MAKQTSNAAGATKSSGGNNSQQGHPLDKLFLDSLKDIYWAEKHLIKALPKLQRAATSPELKNALGEHLAVTREQAVQVEKVFELIGKKAQAKKCDAMEGLVKEAESIVEETDAGTSTRDVGIIMAAQKVEHYEIASYGSLAQLAKTMGLTEAKNILGEILNQEKETDKLLSRIATKDINFKAERE